MKEMLLVKHLLLQAHRHNSWIIPTEYRTYMRPGADLSASGLLVKIFGLTNMGSRVYPV